LAVKVFKLKSSLAPVVWLAVALIAIGFAYVCTRSFFLNTLATRLDLTDPAAGIVVDGLTEADANDPRSHLLAGVYYEKTFDAADLDRSLAEYERAVDLSPSDYTFWLAVAQAKDRLGDADGAEAAFRRSTELAPNYASVQWAFGNFLVRQGRGEEGFPMIAKAAAANPQFAGPAVSVVVQMTGGDIAKTRSLLGTDPGVNAALTSTLASQKRYADAIQTWSAVPIELRQSTYRQTGQDLMNTLMSARQFRAAAIIAGDLADNGAVKPVTGQIVNAGVGGGVKLRSTAPFDWQIADGPEPQIGLSETQKHDGRYALSLLFTQFRAGTFREVSQQVPVEPGARYKLTVWYKSSLKTEAKFQWLVMEIAGARSFGSTSMLGPTDDWTQVSADIVVPSDVDGVKLMLVRSNCTSAACPTSGTMFFDDISLTKE